MSAPVIRPREYGLMAEFESVDHLLEAASATYEAGYRQYDSFSPAPIHEMEHAMRLKRSKIPLLVLLGGLLGLVGGFALCYWVSVIAYPLNVGGRPLNSWPAFIVPTFETTVLLAAFFAVLGMFALNGLPMPYHPVFNVERFALASRDRYFLCIEATDGQYDTEETRRFLEGLRAVGVYEVDP